MLLQIWLPNLYIMLRVTELLMQIFLFGTGFCTLSHLYYELLLGETGAWTSVVLSILYISIDYLLLTFNSTWSPSLLDVWGYIIIRAWRRNKTFFDMVKRIQWSTWILKLEDEDQITLLKYSEMSVQSYPISIISPWSRSLRLLNCFPFHWMPLSHSFNHSNVVNMTSYSRWTSGNCSKVKACSCRPGSSLEVNTDACIYPKFYLSVFMAVLIVR